MCHIISRKLIKWYGISEDVQCENDMDWYGLINYVKNIVMKSVNRRFRVRWLALLALGACEPNHASTKARESEWKIAATTGDNSIPQMRSTNIVAMELLLLLALTLDCSSSFSARLEIDSLLFESVCNPLCLSALYCRSRSLSLSRSLVRHTDTIESFTLSLSRRFSILFWLSASQDAHTSNTNTHARA